MEVQRDMKQLAELVRDTRLRRGLSARKLELRSGLDHSFISKLEKGKYRSVSIQTLSMLADGLDLPPEDLFSLAGYQVPGALPSFGPYLRVRYGQELPAGARAALTELFDTLSRNYAGSVHVDDEEELPNLPRRSP